jgi:hypothetical protein
LSFAVLVCAMFGAVLVSSTGAPRALPRHAFVVTIGATFDRSVSSGVTKSFARQEASDIWHDYGVELEWDDRVPDAALHLDVIVASARTEHPLASSFSILGRTELDRTGTVIGPIRINYEAIEELLRYRSTNGAVVLRERELGRALGRVLAHEIGHVLLGLPSYHDAKGLMRAALPVDDLVQLERQGVQLAEASVNRLHERVSGLELKD